MGKNCIIVALASTIIFLTLGLFLGRKTEKMLVRKQSRISNNRIILGNRFIEMIQSGNMTAMNYSSVTNIGYNTINKSFSLTTLTNMATGTLYLNGSWDEKRELKIKGTIINPMDGKSINIRQQINFINKDNLLIENFDAYDGQEE